MTATGYVPAQKLQVGIRARSLDDQRRLWAQQARQRVLTTDRLLVAKDHLQDFQKPGRLLRTADSILDVLGEVAEEVSPVGYEVSHRVAAIAALDHVPVDADLVQRVCQTSCLQPVVEDAGSPLSCLPIENEHGLTVYEKRAVTAVHLLVPA